MADGLQIYIVPGRGQIRHPYRLSPSDLFLERPNFALSSIYGGGRMVYDGV